MTADKKSLSGGSVGSNSLRFDTTNNCYNNAAQSLLNLPLNNNWSFINSNNSKKNLNENYTWQLFSVTLQRVKFYSFFFC